MLTSRLTTTQLTPLLLPSTRPVSILSTTKVLTRAHIDRHWFWLRFQTIYHRSDGQWPVWRCLVRPVSPRPGHLWSHQPGIWFGCRFLSVLLEPGDPGCGFMTFTLSPPRNTPISLYFEWIIPLGILQFLLFILLFAKTLLLCVFRALWQHGLYLVYCSAVSSFSCLLLRKFAPSCAADNMYIH
jgi:hypothetical protein